MSNRSASAKYIAILLGLSLGCCLEGCSKDKGGPQPTPPLVVPPAAVRDLRADSVSTHALRLLWTAPGADDSSGRAARYDLRYALYADSVIDWWGTAARLSAEVPDSAGTPQRLWVRGLLPEREYRFALRTIDPDSNWSALSNALRVTTRALPDTIPPAAVFDLAVERTGSTTVSLTWTAPGDDGRQGTATRYLVRFSSGQITEDTWASCGIAAVPFSPHPMGTREHLLVQRLSPSARYSFALKTQDEAGGLSPLSRTVSADTRNHATYTAPSIDFPTIASALEATVAGDTVLVEAGTYTEQIQLPARRTLLSRRGMTETTIDCQGRDHGIVLDQSCVLEGITVIGNGSSVTGAAGIVCASDSCVVRECGLKGNHRGLALSGVSQVEGCTLSENTTGIVCSEFSGGIEGCTLEGNDLGISLVRSQAAIKNCQVRSNRLGLSSGDNTALTMDNCIVTDNMSLGLAVGSGSAVIRYSLISGNGVHADPAEGVTGGLRSTAGLLVLEGCIVSYNQSVQQGGGVFCSTLDGSVRIALTSIVGNRSLLSGGGIYVDYGSVHLTDCLITGNSAAHTGGGLEGTGPLALEGCAITGNYAAIEGGGIHTLGLAGATSCTIAGNRASRAGGGVFLRGGAAPLDRCILYGNCVGAALSDAHMVEGGILRLTCCSYDPPAIRLEGAQDRLELNGPQVTDDPLFTAPKPCADAPTDTGDYRLKPGSPCRPAASPCLLRIGAGESTTARR